jgi:hypothetical protein
MNWVVLSLVLVAAAEMEFYPAAGGKVSFRGRTMRGANGSVCFDWPGSELFFFAFATEVSAAMADGANEYDLLHDAYVAGKVVTDVAVPVYSLWRSVRPTLVRLALRKRTEANVGALGAACLRGVFADGPLIAAPELNGRLFGAC